MEILTQTTGSRYFIYPQSNQGLVAELKACWFDSDYWIKEQKIIGESHGRHTVWFIQPMTEADQSTWVLRNYYRGGLIAKLIVNQFVFNGIKRTRAFREVNMLNEMRALNLPVAKVIAAQVVRKGLFYTANLLMEKIEAKNLVEKLTHSELSPKQWNEIGKTVKNFHQQNICHADLNARNILIDVKDKVWLIDFDRCKIRRKRMAWQEKNIARLERSLLKEKKSSISFNFESIHWENFMQGYQSTSS